MKKVLRVLAAVVLSAVCFAGWALRHHGRARVAPGLANRIASASGPQQSARNDQRLLSKIAQLPLSFEANRGQFDPQVKFATRGADYGLFLSGAQATMVHHAKVHFADGDISSAVASLGSAEIHTLSVTQLSWLDSNPKAEPRGENRQAGETNYFIGKDPRAWRRHVQHYERVKLKNLYPGIDLIYHGAQRRVELDYVIAPHVNASAIQVGISGPSIVALDGAGQLSISSSGDKMLLLAPTAYQEKDGQREIVEAHYVLSSSHQFGFRLGAYDATRPVIIDPVLEYAASFGPDANDTIVTDVALDPAGNLYITGTTCETNYPTTTGALQTTGGSNLANFCNDAIVTKLDPTASSLIYSTYVGGQSGVDFGVRVLVDSAGEATVVGTTASTDFPTTAGVFQPSQRGGSCLYGPNVTPNIPCTDSFLMKLSADGSSLEYSTYFGGERAEFAIALTQDSAGDSYIGGATDSTALPLGGSPFQSTYVGGASCQGDTAPCFEGFIAKFNPTGTQLLASTYLGGIGNDMVAGLALDGSGNVYATGAADSANFPTTPGAIQTVHAGTSQGDAYVSKLDANLHTLQYSTFLGGTADDIAFAIRVDATGAAYITGSTLSSNFPTTAGAFQTAYKGPDPSTTHCVTGLDTGILLQPTCGDVFVSKIDPSKPSGSQLIFSTFLGGSGNDFAYNLALDSQKNVWVVGDSNSADFPYTSDAYFTPSEGALFLSEIKNDGTQLLFSTGLSVGGGGLALGISIDSADNVFVAGQGMVSPTPGTYSFGTPGQVFVEKYSSGTAQPAVTLSATSLTFSAVTNSVSAPQSVTLTNSGTGPLHAAIVLGTENTGVVVPQAFSEADNCPASLPAQGTCTITVTYLPNASATNSDGANVQIVDDAPGAPHVIQLLGSSGLTTGASFKPSVLSFPGQQPGVASAAQSSGLGTDSGGANNVFALTTALPVLSGPNASEFNVDESQCQVKAAGCLISVTFTPAASASGTRTATLTVTSTAPNSPQVLALTGTVSTGPFAVLTTGSLIATTIGQTLNTNIFVKNTGGGSLNVTGFNVSGANASEFVIGAGSCGPALTLAPQGICFVNLAFTPTAAGNRTATITLADNETTPASISVTGTGATSGGPQIDAATFGTTVFADTTVGQNTSFFPTFSVSLTNFGTGANAAAHVTSVSITGSDFMTQASPLGTPCVMGFVLAGNQGQCSVGVFFAPSMAGLRTGMLTIQTDAPGAPSFSYTFSGNGINTAAVLLTPNILTFAKTAVGSTAAAQPVTLKNTGNGTLNISNLAIAGPFSQTTTCGATLTAGASCTFSVKFSPTVAGSAAGLISFTGNAAGGGAFAVALNGTGATGPTPLAVPASLTFGNQAVNTVSAPQAVTFSNAGDMAFSFLGVRASENFSATSNCPSSIGPGVSCTINVTFAPTNDTNTGFLTSGTVFVTTNAPGSPFAFSVAGTSTAAAGAATLASISSNLNPSLVGQAVTFTASITSATPGTPSGTVTFLDNGAALGAPVTLSAGKAMFTIATLSPGNHSIFCTYSGDGTFAPSTSSGIGQTVDAVTMTAAASSLNPSTVGENVTFTATVTSPTPGAIAGEVEFLDGASAITNPLALSGGSGSFSTTTLTQGTHSITAKYFGDPSHAVSTSPAVTQVVNAGGALASTSTAVVSSLNPATVGQNVMFTATATSATAGTLTGTLTFFDGATQIGAAVTINAGSAMVSTTTLTQGTHSITAKYSGDTKFAASTSAALPQVVAAGALTSTTTMLTGPATGTAGASVSFMASVTPANGTKVPTGTVTFLDGATNVGNSSLNGSGSASFSTSTLSAGAHTITAQYGGDANFAGSTSNGVAINITAATGTFTLSVAPSSVTVTPSQPGMTVVTVTPVNGFNQAVQFSCANLPEGVDCEFTTHSVTPNGGPATTMLAITEEAENAAGGRKSGAPMATWGLRGGANGLAPAVKTLFVPVLGCEMLLLAGLWRRRKFAGNRAGLRTAFAVLLLMTVATFAGGCSDAPHSHNIGTTITVIGTGPGNQTAMATLTVNIKK